LARNTAIFTVLHAVILAPLPFAEPDRLVSMGNVYPGVGVVKSVQDAIPEYLDRRQMTDVFDSVAEYTDTGYDMGAEGSPVRVKADVVTPSSTCCWRWIESLHDWNAKRFSGGGGNVGGGTDGARRRTGRAVGRTHL
jgi:hypothetical protein